MSTAFATVSDIIALKRPLTEAEQTRAEALLPVVSDVIRQEGTNRGYDVDEMISNGKIKLSVIKSVTVDITMRELNASTTNEAMTQESQAALGYSWSGSYLSPGGGLYVMNSELKRLGLKKQKRGVIEWYNV